MAKKYLDYDGLLYFWQKLKTTFAKTTDVPTKTSDLTNDSGFITSASIPSATTTSPKMNGTAAVGSETKWAKGDHVHPSDTSRVPTTRKVNDKALSADITLYGTDIAVSSSDATTLDSALDGKVDIETGKGLSTNDYTTAEKNKLAGIAAGAEVNVNADWDASSGDAQILNKPTIPSAGTGSSYPAMDGTRSLGSNAGYARVDHVHPSDTTKVDKVTGKGLSTNDYTTAEKNKLAGIATGAEVNVLEGVQVNGTDLAISSKKVNVTKSGVVGEALTVTKVDNSTKDIYNWQLVDNSTSYPNLTLREMRMNLANAGDMSLEIYKFYTTNAIDTLMTANNTALSGKVDTSSVGQASGVCPLDANSKVDSQYLPSYVDDVVEAYPVSGATELSAGWLSKTSGGSALTPEAGVIYVLMSDTTNYSANSQFRWATNTYVRLADGGVSSITNGEIDTIVAS